MTRLGAARSALAGLALLFGAHGLLAAEPAPPAAVFADLDGTWEGTFVGWDGAGRELYRLTVRQTYATLDATTQRVESRDTFSDGRVITGRGSNTARRLPDGSLELACVVEKSDGDRVEHSGRLVTGPDGTREILWTSDRPGRQELFRERVVRQGGETLYLIDGAGRYGETTVLMAGRYRKVGSAALRE